MLCSFGGLDLRPLVLRKQNSDDMIEFQFPNLNFTKLKQWDSWKLHRELVRLGKKAYFKAGKVYEKRKKIGKDKIRTIYKCFIKECKANFEYEQDNKPNSEMKLVKFDNLHHHKKSKDLEEAKRQDISQFIFSLDDNVVQDYIETKKWSDKFDLSKGKALDIIQRVLWQNNTEDQLLARLCKNNSVMVRRYREDVHQGRTQLIFMCNQSMRESFLEYGQTISVGYTNTVLTEKSIFSERYTIGNIFVHDQNLRLLLVGSFVMTRVNQQNWKKLFEFFYECVCQEKDLVHTIIIDSLPCLHNACLRFKKQKRYSFQLLHDWLHVIQRDLKPRLMPLQNGQKILKLLTKAFAEPISHRYQKILQEVSSIITKEHNGIIEDFRKYSNYYCLSQSPLRFQSFSLSSNFVKDLTIRVNQLPFYKNYSGRLFYQYLFIQNWLLKRSKKEVSSVRIGPIKHYSSQLIFLREKIEKKVMEVLIKKYAESKQLERIKLDSLTYRIKLEQQEEQGVIVRFNLQYDHWECDCNFIYLFGLPCEHIICILSAMKGAVAYYINTRWYHKKEHLVIGKTKPGAHISARTRRRK